MNNVEQTIISQYANSPVLKQLIDNINLNVDPAPDLDNFYDFVWNVDTAEAWGLDILGAIVGAPRLIVIAATNEQVSLDDETYRLFIKAKAAANNWDGTPGMASYILSRFYQPMGTYACCIDNQDMTISLEVAGHIPTPAQLAIAKQFYLPVRPGGVGLKSATVTTVEGAPILGLDIENAFISGLDAGAWGASF